LGQWSSSGGPASVLHSQAFRAAYAAAYSPAYVKSEEAAFQEGVRRNYNRYFEEGRSTGYRERYGALYRAAYEQAVRETHAGAYPDYAKAAFRRGQADEGADFAARPVRIINAEATETIVNSVFEPGEALRVRFKLRNFGGAINRQQVRVRIEALDTSSAVVTVTEQALAQNLKANSLITVGEALEFRMNENAADAARQFRISLLYRGTVIGTGTIAVTTKFMTRVDYAEAPRFQEGLESVLKIKVTNESTKATDAGLKLDFSSNTKVVEALTPSVSVGMLNPGETRVVEFKAIARGPGGDAVNAPLLFQAKLGSGRRVGMIDSELVIPLVNDYRITVGAEINNLREAGVSRVSYRISNVGSPLLMKGLQLRVRVLGENAENFSVVGPNPQYLQSLLQGQNLSFVVPVRSKAPNTGGVIELEAQEDGRTVVVHRVEF
jgi:hypothetical protein